MGPGKANQSSKLGIVVFDLLMRPTVCVILVIVTVPLMLTDLATLWGHPSLTTDLHQKISSAAVGFLRKKGVIVETAPLEGVKELYDVWTQMYNLSGSDVPMNITPPLGWFKGREYPLAPHLEDCEFVTRQRMAWETRGPAGEPPPWLTPKEGLTAADPPWVRGADSDNLAGTRHTQALLWQRQHPPGGCTGKGLKFAIMPWLPRMAHGLGSTLHVAAQAMAYSMPAGRILVPMPNFERAEYSKCLGDAYKSLDCYFFGIVSQSCSEQANRLLKNQRDEDQNWDMDEWERMQLNVTVLIMRPERIPRNNFWAPPELDAPWKASPESVEELGYVLSFEGKQNPGERTIPEFLLQSGWWRAQFSRYTMRWPRKEVCHATNKARHEVYGMEVAAGVVSSLPGLQLAERESAEFTPDEGDTLRSIDLSTRPLEKTLWRTAEPYVPRPIASVHVRQWDKGIEMKVFSISSYMWLAERLRWHRPDLTRIWLSTEMQSVVEQAKLYRSWKFYYTNVSRLDDTKLDTRASPESFFSLDQLGDLTLETFVQLQISSECDYFVGALASNYVRLINELRVTGGRLKAGYLTVNYDDW